MNKSGCTGSYACTAHCHQAQQSHPLWSSSRLPVHIFIFLKRCTSNPNVKQINRGQMDRSLRSFWSNPSIHPLSGTPPVDVVQQQSLSELRLWAWSQTRFRRSKFMPFAAVISFLGYYYHCLWSGEGRNVDRPVNSFALLSYVKYFLLSTSHTGGFNHWNLLGGVEHAWSWSWSWLAEAN